MQPFSALLLNLDCDTARRKHMEKQLARAEIAFTRQPGVLGDAVPEKLRDYFFDASGFSKTTMKRGEIGCYASHLLALKRIAGGELGGAVLVTVAGWFAAARLIDAPPLEALRAGG